MKSICLEWRQPEGWRTCRNARLAADLVLYFGSRELLAGTGWFDELRALFPGACLMGCTTGGQIFQGEILDDEINAVALQFDATRLMAKSVEVHDVRDSRRCGEVLGRALSSDDLSAVFLLSDGLHVNGSELVLGVSSQVGGVPVTGGLAGDGSQFAETPGRR